VEAILQLRPDLVFLDVQMPRRNGFEVLARIPPGAMPLIVFVTAFDEYSLHAFDVHAADYLLKPFSDARFRLALTHIKERLRQRSAGDLERLLAIVRDLGAHADGVRLPAMPAPPVRLAIRRDAAVVLLDPEEIEWIEARGDYVRVHSVGRTDLVREPIGSLERRLPPESFVRIHRSALVNLAKVRELRSLPSGDHVAVLESGVSCRLSRSGRERLRGLLGEAV
jgi:two-component system LytT family response regulator